MAVDESTLAADLTASIVPVNAVISTVGTLQGAGLKVLATVSAAVESALPVFQAKIDALDADVDLVNAGGVAAGMPGPDLAAALTSQANEMQNLATLVAAKSYLARVGVNVEEGTG